MKDYTLNKADASNFILNYRRKKDKIIIRYADGAEFMMLYSIELEKELLHQMKEQVLKFRNKEDVLRRKVKIFNFVTVSVIFLAVMAGGIATVLVSPIVLVPAAAVVIAGGVSIVKESNLLKDLEKNKTFIEREVDFQTKIEKDMGLYTDTKRNTKKYIKAISAMNQKRDVLKESDIDQLNLNYIDKMSHSTFFDLVDLIDENDKFAAVVNKPKTKTLSRPKTVDIRID